MITLSSLNKDWEEYGFTADYGGADAEARVVVDECGYWLEWWYTDEEAEEYVDREPLGPDEVEARDSLLGIAIGQTPDITRHMVRASLLLAQWNGGDA